MGENNYTIVQNSYRQRTLTLQKIPYYFWKMKTKGLNIFQKVFITTLVSIFAFGYISLMYFFITEGL